VHGYVTTKNEGLLSLVSFQHQESAGYRNHSALNKNVLSWTGHFHLTEKQTLKTSFLFGDHFYETPGALTRTEYLNDPKGSRPAGGGFPSAVANQASIRQRSFLAGASYQLQLNASFHIKTIAYGIFTELRNPAIRNYGQNSEPHTGGRIVLDYQKQFEKTALHLIAGGEWQQAYSTISIYKNKSGQADSLQTQDAINNRQQLAFTQASLDAGNWNLTAGLSWSQLKVGLQRFSPATTGLLSRRFTNQFSPRAVLSKKLGKLLLYTGISKGFSPPATTELSPSGSVLNLDLFPEKGWNTDAGIKAVLSRFYIDLNAFHFATENTIVQRRDAGGGESFINAGSTRQRGVETSIQYNGRARTGGNDPLFLWLSHSWHQFEYVSFRQLAADYSGNAMPGNPDHQLTVGGAVPLGPSFNLQGSYTYTSRTALNDGNTEYGDPSHLVQINIRYQQVFSKKWLLKLMAGIENALDETYSLGYDINGAGGRYYNAAPGRSYFAGIGFTHLTKN
jgi:iron complex outermembrane receptor protein